MMDENKSPKREPDPDRVAALRSLPREITESLTKEELDAFLYEDVWPDSLQEKLNAYIVEE
jgi:hypothetical protein